MSKHLVDRRNHIAFDIRRRRSTALSAPGVKAESGFSDSTSSASSAPSKGPAPPNGTRTNSGASTCRDNTLLARQPEWRSRRDSPLRQFFNRNVEPGGERGENSHGKLSRGLIPSPSSVPVPSHGNNNASVRAGTCPAAAVTGRSGQSRRCGPTLRFSASTQIRDPPPAPTLDTAIVGVINGRCATCSSALSSALHGADIGARSPDIDGNRSACGGGSAAADAAATTRRRDLRETPIWGVRES